MSAKSKVRERARQWRSSALATIFFLLFSVQLAGAGRLPMKTVLVLGDSLSEGLLISPRQAWPMLIVEKFRGIGPNFQVINASASGGTTEGGLRRLPPHLQHQIDIFILELGINDAFRGIPVEQIRTNLQSIIDQVKARNPNAAIVVIGMQFPMASSEGKYVAAFGKTFGDLAESNHAALVPYLLEGVAGDPRLNLDDHIHPNAAGHKILADTVWRTLEPIAREVASK